MWSAKQQTTVALSTAESEISALTDLGRDVIWLRRLLADLGTPVLSPTPCLEDSKSAIKWSTDAASWSRTRHIDTYYHKLREWISANVLKVEYCHTSVQRADVFTKALPTEAHLEMKKHILGECASTTAFFKRSAAPTAA